ncbi:uncharacterized protein LTHEOB_6084 [Lasiodiplodia theobromae]|uniref:uncharacterized protein n=1 Tax=Lasiodiplodia theobromae TaxID=45133 RepID=UPI0015C348AE|nr:uncharacterized protein LTHEOB_6084 [Lasiodiplodia theobromae]KAF4544514.1 hypothetical protein LTHEOB_6084 [Lasiodiplodia theobromae]
MSGLEAIGAIASVSQLVQYTATLISKLHALYRNVEQSGKRCKLYREQIDELLKIAGLVDSLKEVLRSEVVTTHVQALLRTIENIDKELRQGCAGDISRRWKRCLEAVRWGKAEEAILRGFEDLERDKSCLALSILATYGTLISRIDRNVGDGLPQLQEQVEKIERTLSNCSISVKEEERTQEVSRFLNKSACPHQIRLKMHKADGYNKEVAIRGPRDVQPMPQTENCNGHEPSETESADGRFDNMSESRFAMKPRSPARSDSGYESIPETTIADESPPSNRSWSGNTASEGAMQINGNVGKTDAIDSALVNCHWSQNEAKGRSKQVNGEILDAKFAAIFFCQTPSAA